MKKYKYHSAKKNKSAWIESPNGGGFGDLMDATEELNRLRSACFEMAKALIEIRDNSYDGAATNSAELGLAVAEIVGIEESDFIDANVPYDRSR